MSGSGCESVCGGRLGRAQDGALVIMLHHCLNRWQAAHHLRLARVRLLSPQRTQGPARIIMRNGKSRRGKHENAIHLVPHPSVWDQVFELSICRDW